ncbi:MAG: hypothetical protein AAB724_00185, partial [Patescibacteria group bacterium]
MKNINLLPGLSKQEIFKKKAYKKIIIAVLTSFLICVLSSVIATFLRIKITDEYALLLEKKSALKNELTNFLSPEAQAASVLMVPVPVPAVRRPALVPPPAAPEPVDPIENLAGKWSGQATMVPTSG